jgi:hypothetical protein
LGETRNIDAHKGKGGTSCTPSKQFSHKNAIKQNNRGPFLYFLITPNTPLKRITNKTSLKKFLMIEKISKK